MVMIHKYRIVENADGFEECRSQEEALNCVKCGCELVYRDKRKRKYRNRYGEKKILIIRRLQCVQCRRLHNELPDLLVPYKQCEAETIEKALEEILGAGKSEKAVEIAAIRIARAEERDFSEDVPEELPDLLTIKRWRCWVEAHVIKINSVGQVCRKQNFYISNYFPLKNEQIKIEKVIQKGAGWLSAIVEFLILNSLK